MVRLAARTTFFRVLATYLGVLVLLGLAGRSVAREPAVLREDFNDLNSWKVFRFPKIARCSTYTIERRGGESCLRMESQRSASGLVFKKEFDVRQYPTVRWRWKVENVYDRGDAKTKAGDDFPARLYVLFKCDPKTAGLLARRKAEVAKRLYGGFPVDRSLCYVWGNRRQAKPILPNAYTKLVRMVLLQQGAANCGKWVEQEARIPEDFRRAFKKPTPQIASLAIMNDSDNTGEGSLSYIDYIELRK